MRQQELSREACCSSGGGGGAVAIVDHSRVEWPHTGVTSGKKVPAEERRANQAGFLPMRDTRVATSCPCVRGWGLGGCWQPPGCGWVGGR